MKTRRGRLKELLQTRESGYTLKEIQDIMEAKRQALLMDLRHLQMSLRHTSATLLMVPPECRACGFTFRVEHPKAPSRCPRCKSDKVTDPVFRVDAPQPAPPGATGTETGMRA